ECRAMLPTDLSPSTLEPRLRANMRDDGQEGTEEPTQLTRTAVFGAGWSVLSSVSRQILQLATLAIVARRLGPFAYGLMGMATLVTVFLSNFRDLGTATAVIQRLEINQRLLSTLFWSNLVLGCILAAIGVLASRPPRCSLTSQSSAQSSRLSRSSSS